MSDTYYRKPSQDLHLYDLLKMHRERAARRLTQKELARLVGVSDKSIRDWEYGVSLPTAANLKKLIEIFLTEHLLTAGKEQTEAEELWARRREEDNFSTFPPFDKSWFTGLTNPAVQNTRVDKNESPSPSDQIEPAITAISDSPSARDSGILTFLFTDIEGSTKLWENYPETMKSALAHHDQILRQAIETQQGKVFKTVGDAFYATFPRVGDALQAVLAAQQTLQEADWGEIGGALRVRMALHTGTAEERDGDYFGSSLNRVARILSAGHGGQVLVSLATAELLRDQLPPDHDLRDLGEHRLKNLSRSEHIFQLIAPELPSEFPPLMTLEVISHNLPVQLTSFVGREQEKEELKQLLEETRLLTLVGSGGSGKTRLSIQLAAEVLETYKDGVWLVELAGISDPTVVPKVVATILDVREVPGQAILKTLEEYLRPKRLLLILDNCEHLIESSAQLADDLLKNCPKIQILATSREALGITGETVWRVPSLSVPDISQSLENLSQYGAVRLFIERAEVVQRSFTLTNLNAPAVIRVCTRLDGIPLAIELAAARIKSLSVEQIATRLDDAFRLLTQGGRTTLPRHQTLRAAIDWSYDLLSDLEQTLLRRLAVFGGGWTLEAAEAVCAGDEVDEYEIIDHLTRLVDKSLVVGDESVPGYPEQIRYHLLETIRQYVLEKLRTSQEITEVSGRHLNWFASIAEQAEFQLRGAEQILWFQRLETEHDNLRLALQHYQTEQTETSEVDQGLLLSSAIWWFWYVRGHFSEGQKWLKVVLEKNSGASLPRAKALNGAGFIAAFQGDRNQAAELYSEALTLFRQLSDRVGEAFTLACMARQTIIQSNLGEARRLFEESLSLARLSRDKWTTAFVLDNLGTVAARQPDYARAKEALGESLTIRREIGDKLGLAASLNNLAGVAWMQHDFDQAMALQQESLAMWQELGDRRGVARCLSSLGQTASAQNDLKRSEEFYSKSLSLSRELSDRRSIMTGLCRLGETATQLKNYEKARNYFKESLVISRDLGNKLIAAECLEGLGWVSAALNHSEIAVRLLGAAAGLREAIGTLLSPNDQKGHGEALEQVQIALQPDIFQSRWEMGHAMTLEGAIAYALNIHPEIDRQR